MSCCTTGFYRRIISTFTDLPLFIIGGALTGSARFLIYLVPVIVFSLLLLAALRLAAAPGAGRFASMAAILFLIGIPFGPLASFMLGADIHIATIALCLWAMVCAQPALSRATLPALAAIALQPGYFRHRGE